MALQLDFSNAEAQRLRITQEQQRKIQELYKQASAEIARQAGKAPRVPSDALRKSYLNTLQGQIDERLRDIEAQLNGTVQSSMTAAAAATVGDAKQFLQQNGLSIRGAYSHVPADIVNAVASGQLYSGNWTLSRALWLNTKETQQDVQNIIAQGIIQNKSAFDIAKDLEKYVDPTAKKDWDWSKVYPGTRRVVDYNAQRLARTMVSHAYQQAFVRTTQKNPFVKKYKWEASNSERTCELCEERNGQLFDKDDLPLDHPNGMCTFTAVMDDMDTIGERLGDWAAGKDDPELDQWAKDIYGKGWEAKKPEIIVRNNEDIQKKWGIPCSKKLEGKAIENLDGALTYMKETFVVDPSKYISGFDTENPFYARGYEAYWGTDRGIHVHKDSRKSIGKGTWIHEMTHALTGQIAKVELGGVYQIDETCTEIVREGFSGMDVRRRNGVPTKSEMAHWVTTYGGTDVSECVAEAERCYANGNRSGSEAIAGIHESLLKHAGGLK